MFVCLLDLWFRSRFLCAFYMFGSVRFRFGKQNFDWLVRFGSGRTVKHCFGRSLKYTDTYQILTNDDESSILIAIPAGMKEAGEKALKRLPTKLTERYLILEHLKFQNFSWKYWSLKIYDLLDIEPYEEIKCYYLHSIHKNR